MSVVIPREARKIREEFLNIAWLLGIGGTAVSLAIAIESFPLILMGTVLTYVAWKRLRAGRDPTTYAVLGGALLIASTSGIGMVSGILAILGVLIDHIRSRW